jgi:hypothetical protein
MIYKIVIVKIWINQYKIWKRHNQNLIKKKLAKTWIQSENQINKKACKIKEILMKINLYIMMSVSNIKKIVAMKKNQ